MIGFYGKILNLMDLDIDIYSINDRMMKSISFTITEAEIRSFSAKKLTDEQLEKIIITIENDPTLWKDVETSIRDAIDFAIKNGR